MAKNNCGPHIVALFQPQCKHLSQRVTGGREGDGIQVTKAKTQGDAKVLPLPSKVGQC